MAVFPNDVEMGRLIGREIALDLDTDVLLEDMLRLISTAPTISTGWNTLVDYCERVVPDTVWNWLREIDVGSDTVALQRWLTAVLIEEPPAPTIKAFWFGLFHPVLDGRTTCGLYISGSVEDYNPDDPDWACWTEDTYLPDGRYAASPVLDAIYTTTQADRDALILAEYLLCLGYVCLVIPAVMLLLEPSLLLGEAERRSIVAGFDDGDSVYLGAIERDGWKPNYKD